MATSLPPHPERSDTLTPAQAAEILHVSPVTLRNWRFNMRGPRYIKMGGIVLYRHRDLIAYIDASVVDPALPRPRGARRGARGGDA